MVEVTRRAVNDIEFRKQLKADPNRVCRDADCDLPEGIEIEIVELKLSDSAPEKGNQPTKEKLRLFIVDSDGELADRELEAVAGGGFFRNVANFFCPDKTEVRPGRSESLTSPLNLTYVDHSLGGYEFESMAYV